jgi:BolA protein
MGHIAQAIEEKLTQAFQPVQLEVVDDSARHAGHAGAPGSGESHFNVTIVSAAFEGQGRVQRQRRVYDALKAELAGPVHALSVKAFAPSERAPQ